MSTRAVSCPNCQKAIQVPAEAAGKKIKCKACQHVFTVPGDDPPRAAVAKPVAKPATAKPAVAKPAAASPPPPPPPAEANAPIPFADDDDDDDDDSAGNKPKAYLVTEDPDADIPRCPFCAVDLDPPDAKICTNCGYDLTARKRHRTVKTYALTGGDYFKWWLPAIIWGAVLFACGGCVIWSFVTLRETEDRLIKEGGPNVSEKENPLTGKKEFVVPPAACYVCAGLIVIIMSMWGAPVIWKRLRQPKPTEEEKRK